MKGCALALAITLLWLVAGPVAAREPPAPSASDDAGGVRALTTTNDAATPFATDASACSVKPRTLNEVKQLVKQGQVARMMPQPSPLPIADLPDGKPVSVETIAAITTTTEQLMACINAGDWLRALALVSDHGVETMDGDLTASLHDPSFATPHPAVAGKKVSLDEIVGARMLPDGRVGAVIRQAGVNDTPVFWFFIQEGDRWLVDGSIEIAQNRPNGQGPCCATPTGTASPTGWQPVNDENYEGVIVPEAAGPDFFRAVDGTAHAGYWTPTVQQIAQLEDDLLHHLTPPSGGVNSAPDKIGQYLETYHRQYAGFITADGQRQIEVNFFCAAYDGLWQSQPVAVQDGGTCFFRITYDLTTGKFSDLRVNGDA
jgi:hypothetical protein